VSKLPDKPYLKRCNLAECEAMCCANGVYLSHEDIQRITEAVNAHPEYFKRLPADYIIEGSWAGKAPGLKTATRPHQFKHPVPAHWEQARCVFCLEDGKCSLQVAATENGLHPWHYKPTACWLFPLTKRKTHTPVLSPVQSRDDDPANIAGYPGYACFTECGKHREDGRPWQEVLEEEIAMCKKKGWQIVPRGKPKTRWGLFTFFKSGKNA
jgi:hypothetical protein